MGAACAGALAPWMSACTQSSALRVGLHPWIGYETLTLARDFRWMPPEIELRRGKSVQDSIAGLQSGALDAACMTLDEMLKLRSTGIPLTVALVFDVSAGADVVLARAGIQKLPDIAGKRIAVEANAVGALVLSKLLEAAKLRLADVTVVNLSVEAHAQAWHDGVVDVAVGYPPFSYALELEGAHPIFDSREMPDMIFDVLAVRSDRVDEKSALAHGLVAGHFRGLAHLHGNRQDALFRIAAIQGVQPEVVQKSLAGVVLPSLQANREYLMAHTGHLLKGAKRLCEVMVRERLLERPDDLGQFVSTAWLPQNDA
jgi:NitT/TauT family transport system substrate-binding protein